MSITPADLQTAMIRDLIKAGTRHRDSGMGLLGESQDTSPIRRGPRLLDPIMTDQAPTPAPKRRWFSRRMGLIAVLVIAPIEIAAWWYHRGLRPPAFR